MMSKAMSLLLLCLLSPTLAADTKFRVSTVTFTDKTAEFTFVAKLHANETAALTLTNPLDPEVILSSLNRSMPVTVSIEVTAEKISKIIISATSTTETDVKIAYSRPFVKDEFKLVYALNFDAKELTAVALVIDKTNSDATWLNTDIVYQYGTATSLRFNADRMDKNAWVSSADIRSYKVDIAQAPYFRTGDVRFGTIPAKIYDVLWLKNSGAAALPPAPLIIYGKNSDRIDGTLLTMLAPGQTGEAYGDETAQLNVDAPKDGNSSVEVLSVERGLLKARKWKGNVFKITNKTTTKLEVCLGATSHHKWILDPLIASSVDAFLPDTPLPDLESRSLLNIDKDELGKGKALLANLHFIPSTNQALLDEVQRHYKAIEDARQLASQINAKRTHLSSVVMLAAASKDPQAMMMGMKAESDKGDQELMQAAQQESAAFAALVDLLLQ